MFGVETCHEIHEEKLTWLKPIILQWLRLNRDYIEDCDCRDSLYWYNERANISAFAGATWRSGGFALEEYNAIKGKEETKGKGRVDLYIQYAGHRAVFEAKQHWLHLSAKQKQDFTGFISAACEKSMADVMHTQNSLNHPYGIALNFIPTYFKKEENVGGSLILFREAVESCDCSFYAWFNNASGKDVISSKKNICNSVALIGRLA
ncbi:hypothetical protein [uncultured Thiodictyon sp.]|uniref:hypothetical protein n=1 Tax=uncultured Thiodictyon sp. TaxID=1846217 RepID=UPI0025EF0731|nr:hypothetical protein [uncultured Thiodictyon sp.]